MMGTHSYHAILTLAALFVNGIDANANVDANPSEPLPHLESTVPPNVVMVIVDDAGWNDIGYHNNDFRTPTLDTLAAEGVKLEGMYTDRQCTPARAQLLTGRYNMHIGMQDNIIYALEPRGLNLGEELLPEKLSKVGYDTIGIGKWHLGHFQESYCPWKRGFDHYFGNMLSGGNQESYVQNSEEWFVRSNSAWAQYHSSYEGFYLLEGHASGYEALGDRYQGIHSTELYTSKAIDHLEAHTSPDTPFFLYLAYQAVHTPLMVEKEWLATSKCDQRGFDNDSRELLCAMMTQLDYWQSKLIDYLKGRGVWKNTLYVFLSDNGANPGYGGSNYPLRGEKGEYWDGGVRSPVFVAGGFVTRALRDDAWMGEAKSPHMNLNLMHITDLPATICALAGIPIDEMDGVNQWDVITTPNASIARNEVLININSEMYGLAGAIRVGKYKYMKTPEPDEDTLFWMMIEKMTQEPVTEKSSLMHIFKELQGTLRQISGKDNSSYVFNMEANPGERTDGECAVFEECNNLLSSPEYSHIHANLRTRFFYHLGNMFPSSVKFQYDGALANPDFFNGSLGVPWRDKNGIPFVIDDLSPFLNTALRASEYTLSNGESGEDFHALFSATGVESEAEKLSIPPTTRETSWTEEAIEGESTTTTNLVNDATGISQLTAWSWQAMTAFIVFNIAITSGTVIMTSRWMSSRAPRDVYTAIA